MYDANAILQAEVTKTATFTGSAFDLKTGTPKRGLKARLHVGTVAGTSPTLDVTVTHSDDDTTYATLATFPQITAGSKVEFRTVETSKRYIKAVATIGGTAPSFIYDVALGIASP